MPTTALPAPPISALYEADFYDWAMRTAALLREGRFAELDVEHAAEEIEGLARGDYRQIENRTVVLIAHLLKKRYQDQASKAARSWDRTIVTQRLRLHTILQDSPSLRRMVPAIVQRAWEHALKLAIVETGLDRDAFPTACPFTLEEIYGADIVSLSFS
jgi:hypothetical protein